MTVAEAVDQYLEWVRGLRTRNTWLVYRTRLKSFVLRLGARDLAALTRADVEEWAAAAARRPDGRLLAPDTRRANVANYGRFERWCVKRQLLAGAIAPDLEKPKGRKRGRIPTPEETAQILAAGSPAFVRIYEALRHCGARPDELCTATIGEYDVPGKVIVRTDHKTAHATGEERRIAVGKRFAAILAEAIGERTDAAAPIFLDAKGRAWSAKRLSEAYRYLRDKLGLKRDLVLYLARHEHGTVMTKKLGIHAAAEALGHRSINTTQRYAHATDQERAANQDAFGE